MKHFTLFWLSLFSLLSWPFFFCVHFSMPIGSGMGYQMASRIDNGYQSFLERQGVIYYSSFTLVSQIKMLLISLNHWLTFSLSPILLVFFTERILHRFHLSCSCNSTPKRGWLFHLLEFHSKTPFSHEVKQFSIYSWGSSNVNLASLQSCKRKLFCDEYQR